MLPSRRGSRSWWAPLWAASWCRRSSSSPPAGSSGCHCGLGHSALPAVCHCRERRAPSRRVCVRAVKPRPLVTYFFIVPFPIPRSEGGNAGNALGFFTVSLFRISAFLLRAPAWRFALTPNKVGQRGVQVVRHELLRLTGRLTGTGHGRFQDAPCHVCGKIQTQMS